MAEALRFIFGKADNSNEASIQHTVFTAATSAAMFAMGYSIVRSLPRYSVFWGIVATAFAARANQVNCDQMNMFSEENIRERFVSQILLPSSRMNLEPNSNDFRSSPPL